MSNLRRTSIGDINISQALAKSEITPELLQKKLAINR
jgi:hypothetical protein